MIWVDGVLLYVSIHCSSEVSPAGHWVVAKLSKVKTFILWMFQDYWVNGLNQTEYEMLLHYVKNVVNWLDTSASFFPNSSLNIDWIQRL